MKLTIYNTSVKLESFEVLVLIALLICIIIICIGSYYISKHLNSIDDDEIKEYRHWDED